MMSAEKERTRSILEWLGQIMAGQSAKVSAKILIPILKSRFIPILRKQDAPLREAHFIEERNSLKSIRAATSSQTFAMDGLRDFCRTGQQPILSQRDPKYWSTWKLVLMGVFIISCTLSATIKHLPRRMELYTRSSLSVPTGLPQQWCRPVPHPALHLWR